MSCPFYKFQSALFSDSYYCIKQEKSVSTDIYYKYCRNYDYDDCPIYKHESSSGGCFLTSACTEARGLPDDCYELTTLRAFRDEYMAKQNCGNCEIAHYYQVAPAIVAKINAGDCPKMVFERIYNELVMPCISMIEKSDLEGAHYLYRNYVLLLEKEYLTA